MTLQVRDSSNVLQNIASIQVRNAANALVDIAEIWVRDGTNTLVQVWGGTAGGGLSATVSSDFLSGSTSSHAPQRISMGSTVTVTPSDPTATIFWTFDDVGWDATNPTGFTTNFVSPTVDPSDSTSTVAHGTLTKGADTFIVDVNLSAFNFGT